MDQDRSGLQSGYARGADADPVTLPLAREDQAVPRERADAARNRARILEAAGRLFAEQGVAAVSMDDVAAAAGVGKGTLYRRFGDRGELAVALLSAHGEALQERVLRGEPPLGPGAPPVERLEAFLDAYLSFQVAHLDLVLMSETAGPGARLRKGSYGFWRRHCTYLLEEAGAPDALVRAELLLGACAAEQVDHWLRRERRGERALRQAVRRAARDLAGGAEAPSPERGRLVE